MGAEVWFLARDGRRIGPLTREELDEAVRRGEVAPDDLLWTPAFGSDWRRAADALTWEGAASPRKTLRRVERAFGPLVAGLILDAADFATTGPWGFWVGLPVGVWLARVLRLPWPTAMAVGLLAGLYCAVPFTRYIPLATLVGAIAQYHEMGQKDRRTTRSWSESAG